MSKVMQEYINKMFSLVIILVTGSTTIAGITFLALKLMGFYPNVSIMALGIFLTTCVIYLAVGIVIIRSSYTINNAGEKVIKPNMITAGKIFIIILEAVQYNFIAYMIPSREFWAYGFYFVICASFLLDTKLICIVAAEIGASVLVSSFIHGAEGRLPVRDELFVPEVLLRIICAVLSLAAIVLLVALINRFLVNMKKNEIEENNRRVNSVLSAVQGISANLLESGKILSQISENEEKTAGALTETSKNLLQESNALSGKASSGITNLKELTECGNRVSENAERVGEVSQLLIKKSTENEETLNSLQKVNKEVVDSMNTTTAVAASLSEAVKGIDVTLKLINKIATQTHILSINASIEAAGAGEAGKGFSAVAREVGSLAANTGRSLADIREVMDNLQKNVTEMTKYVEQNYSKLTLQNRYFSDVFNNMQEMNKLLDNAVRDIENMNEVQSRQLDVIRRTVEINEDIADGIRSENTEFTEISHMVEKNADDASLMTEQVSSINNMASQINMILNN